jgi:hypothetical protein
MSFALKIESVVCSETWIYRVSKEECARLREGFPYVKVYRYNPKQLCPKLNGYGDNGQRKVWSSLGFHALYLSADSIIGVGSLSVVSYYGDSVHASCTSFRVTSALGIHVPCIVLGTLRTTMT